MKGVNIVGSVEWAGENNENSATKGVIILTNDNFYAFPCPHCLSFIRVKADELNCRIFRHGIYKKNYRGIPPHLPKKKCEELVRRACIFGCAKPLEFIGGGKGNLEDKSCVVRKCDYK